MLRGKCSASTEQCSFEDMDLIPPQFKTSNGRALFEDGRWHTYADVASDVEALAERLPAMRSLAFCFCRINMRTVVNYLACLRAGHAVALLDAALHPSARLVLIERYQPELLLSTGDDGETAIEHRDRRSHGAPHPALAVLLSTSGTTGSPKLVRLSAGNILHNAESIRAALAIEPDDELSAMLLQHARMRQYPELASLGFWMRKAETERLRAEFLSLDGGRRRLNPRGIVFQIAAGNVDTLFAYTWTFALLTGNKSIVRLPSKRSAQIEILCEAIGQVLLPREEFRRSNYFVRYGHEREITETFSEACDVRTIWGGNAAANEIRGMPLGPYAKELCFADRYSLSAISSAAYRGASATVKQQLVRDFFNDAFWFDQMACSSPRLVVWCGEKTENAEAAAAFFAALEEEACRRGYKLDLAAKMSKFLFACEAVLDRPVTSSIARQHVTVLELDNLENFDREHYGGGSFLQYQSPALPLIAPYLKRRDQTLTYFGFERNELDSFARSLNGSGIDRIVPIGQALAFGRFWDGYDLLAEFTRSTVIQ